MSQKFKSEVELQALNNATTDTDKFLVSDSGTIKYRTGSQLLSDLGVSGIYVPYTGATGNVDLGTHTLLAHDLVINHTSGSGVAASITKGGNGEALTINKTSGSGNAMSVTGGLTSLVDLTLSSIPNATIDTDKFIVSDGGAIKYRTGAQVLSDIGGQAALTNPVTGTGTTNYLSKFTGASTLGNSLIFDNGTNVGIGTTNPNAKLEVWGEPGQPATSGGVQNGLNRFRPGSTVAWGESFDFGMHVGVSGPPSYAWMQATNAGNHSINYNIAINPNGGNVGIGTTTPQSALSIGTNHGTLISIGQPIWANNIVLRTGWDGSDFTQLQVPANSANSANITLRNSGNVGIGTESPGARLDVRAQGALSTDIAFRVRNSADNNDLIRVQGNGNVGIGTTSPLLTATGRGNVTINGSNDSILSLGVNGVYSGYLYSDSTRVELSSNTQPIAFVTNGNEKMRITSAGNVGIGVTNPSSKLHVYSSGEISRLESSTTTMYQTFRANGTNVGYIGNGAGTIYDGNATDFGIQITNNFVISTGGSSERMRITSAGNVGIGTSSPSARLHVEVNDNTYAPTAYFVNNNTGSGSIASANFIAGGKSSSIVQFSAGFLVISANDTAGGLIIVKPRNADSLFLDHVSSTSRITIGSSNVASHPLRVTQQVSNVSIYADYDIVAYSDQSVKENVRPIENVINRINQSRGVLYDRIDSGEKDNIGFIAQELETTFPELVVTNEDGTKAVKYQNAVAVLFEAIKEQNQVIEDLKQRISKLEA